MALLTLHMTAGRTRGFYLVLHSLRGIGQLSAMDDERLWMACRRIVVRRPRSSSCAAHRSRSDIAVTLTARHDRAFVAGMIRLRAGMPITPNFPYYRALFRLVTFNVCMLDLAHGVSFFCLLSTRRDSRVSSNHAGAVLQPRGPRRSPPNAAAHTSCPKNSSSLQA